MKPYMPTLVIRTQYAEAVVEINGSPVGDVSPDMHIALPLSQSGEYYIGIFPLSDNERRYYPILRKLRYQNGIMQFSGCGDVEAYVWPGGVFEAVFSPGMLPVQPEYVFPFTVDQMMLPNGCIATAYYENGLRLAVEEGLQLHYGTALGETQTGKLYLLKDNLLCAIAGKPNLPGGELPDRYGNTLLILDQEYREKLRVTADAVGFENDTVVSFSRLPTMLMHERRKEYRYTEGRFMASEPVLGFFTHTPAKITQSRDIMRAFCEAVQYDLWEEAFSYLSPGLAAGLTPQTIRECMGGFVALRKPFLSEEQVLGLCYPEKEGAVQVRVFTFSFDNGKIDNILEE